KPTAPVAVLVTVRKPELIRFEVSTGVSAAAYPSPMIRISLTTVDVRSSAISWTSRRMLRRTVFPPRTGMITSRVENEVGLFAEKGHIPTAHLADGFSSIGGASVIVDRFADHYPVTGFDLDLILVPYRVLRHELLAVVVGLCVTHRRERASNGVRLAP